MPDLATTMTHAGATTLAATGPETLGYIIIAIGVVGLGLSLLMLSVVTRRQNHR
jgi:LPXTG-motif cell wall-anchored protein